MKGRHGEQSVAGMQKRVRQSGDGHVVEGSLQRRLEGPGGVWE